MQRYKIVVQIILLILSVINFALAVPILERGILEVRAEERDVANDQDLRLLDPRSPMNPGAPGSTPPVGVPASPPEHDDLLFNMDLNDHNPPQPGQEVTDGPGPGPHSTDSPTHIGPYHSTDNPLPLLNNGDSDALGLPTSPSSHDSSPSLHVNMPHPYGIGPGDVPHQYINPFGLSSPATMSEPGIEWVYAPERVTDRPASYPGYSRPPILYGPLNPGEHSPPDLESSASPGSPGSLQHDSNGPEQLAHGSEGSELDHDLQNSMMELLRGGRLKRRISRPRSVNAAQRELQDSSYSTIKGSDKTLDAPAATAMP